MKERYETFTTLINRISRSVKKIKNLEMEELGLRSPHISCLYYLYLFPGLTATELCERCEEDKATVSRSLDFLEKGGFLIVEAKTSKRYKSPLLLTEKGSEAGNKIARKIESVLAEVSAVLSEDEREVFYRSLSNISNSLEEIVKNIK